MKPKVSIIILNWNGLKDTVECLDSLKKIRYPNYKVIVIDNGSKGNDDNVLEKRYKEYIKLIRNKKNLGFTGGNNIGMKYALRDSNINFILLLNNDTVVDKRFLNELVKVARSDKNIGIACPKIYYYDQPNKIQFAGGRISWWTGSPTHIGDKQKDSKKYSRISETMFASGCCLLIKKEVIQKIGLLDNHYFTSYEDVDYSIRTKRVGFKVIYNGRSKIWHKVGASTNKKSLSSRSAFSLYYGVRNRTIFMKKNCPHFYNLFFFIIFQIIFRGFVSPIYFFIKEKDFKLVKACLKGLWDGLLYSPKST